MKPIPTRAQVEELKQNWLGDPCWDIEDTEGGYEHYRDELLAFRLQTEQRWEEQRNAEITKKAQELHLNPVLFHDLVKHIMHLEWRIRELEKKVD